MFGAEGVLVSSGKAFEAVAGVRVEQGGQSWIVPIESPSGAVLVGVEGEQEARWLAVDETGAAMGEGGVLRSAIELRESFEATLADLLFDEIGRGP